MFYIITILQVFFLSSTSGLSSSNASQCTFTSLIQDTAKKAKVDLEETFFKGMTVLTISDTALSNQDFQKVFQKGYGALFSFAGQNNLVPSRVLAIYHSNKPPFVMEVAIEVNKLPAGLSGRIKSRSIDEGKMLIAHYKGPYEQIHTAYSEIAKWLQAHHHEAKDSPFEIYLNDPSSTTDPYEHRTDVCQFFK